ncbi:MAG: hypothetical protein QG673_623 [Pseudomonadota bacterium]|nr:hypothetical protein [Pseudomonadota bacterium]
MPADNYYQQLFDNIDGVYAQLAEVLFKNEVETSFCGSKRVFEFIGDQFPYLTGNVLLVMLFLEFKKYPRNDKNDIADMLSQFISVIKSKRSSLSQSQLKELLSIQRLDRMTFEDWLCKMVDGRPQLVGWLSSVSAKSSAAQSALSSSRRSASR